MRLPNRSGQAGKAGRLRRAATLLTIILVVPVMLMEGIEVVGALREKGWSLSASDITQRDLVGLVAFFTAGIGAIVACWRLWAGGVIAGVAALVFVVAVPDGAFVLIPLAIIFGLRVWGARVTRDPEIT